MIRIELNDYKEFKEQISTKNLEYFSYKKDERYFLVAIDGPLYFFHRLSKKNSDDFKANLESNANKKIGNFYSREPFSTKVLKDGSKLFRRKHGKKATVPAGQSLEVIFTVPYASAKINKLEIIDANPLDRVDLLVKSPVDAAVAAAYGLPADYMLNQFGFNVVVSELLYSDKSDYDAEVYQGFQIVAKIYNDSDNEKEYGFNLIYHEMVKANKDESNDSTGL